MTGGDRVDLAVVSAREPEHAPVGRDAAHVRRAAARDPPGAHRAAGAKRDQGDGAGSTVGDVEVPGVAARVQPMGAAAGALEALLAQLARIDEPDAVGGHVRDVERAPVGRQLDVLGHRARAQSDGLDDTLAAQVDDHHPPGELAGDEREAAVGGVVHVVDAGARGQVHRIDQAHAVGLAEVELAAGLGDDDCAAPVGGEVQVVGVRHRDRAAVMPGARVDRSEAVAVVVGDPQRAQVPRRGDVLRQGADGEVVDDPGRALIDDVDRVGPRVGHVNARDVAPYLGRQHPRARGAIDVERRGAGDDVCTARELQQLAVHTAPRVATAGHHQPVAGRDRPEVRERRRQPPRRAHVPRGGIDGPDAAALAGGRVAAPAQDVEGVAERRAGGVRERGRQVADHPHAMVGGVDAEDLVARPDAVGTAGDEQAAAHRGGCGIAERVRQGGDLAGGRARAEGEHRAQRGGRGVAADDVGRRADRHRGRIRHRHRQVAGKARTPARRDLRDGVDRAARRAAAEDVDTRPERGGADVVGGGGQRADPPRRPGRHAHDVGHRAVGAVQPAGGEDRGPDAGQPGQLHGRGQRARRHDAQADARRRVRARRAGRRRRGARRAAMRWGRVRSAGRQRRGHQRRDDRAPCGPGRHRRTRGRRWTSTAASAATTAATASTST